MFFQTKYNELFGPQGVLPAAQFPRDVYTYARFEAAVATVRSRSHAPLEGDALSLVPLADAVSCGRCDSGERGTNAHVKHNCSCSGRPSHHLASIGGLRRGRAFACGGVGDIGSLQVSHSRQGNTAWKVKQAGSLLPFGKAGQVLVLEATRPIRKVRRRPCCPGGGAGLTWGPGGAPARQRAPRSDGIAAKTTAMCAWSMALAG